MTREEIINRIYQNSGISELGEVPFGTSPVETLEDYPYSLPAGTYGEFRVPSGGSVGAVGAQSFGGGRGGGLGFPLMLPNLSGSQPESAEEYAQEYADAKALEYAAQNAQESAAESAAQKQAQERAAQQIGKEDYKSIDITFEKPQIKTESGEIRARGEKALEDMREAREIRSGERLSAQQMANAPEAQQMQFGRFADNAKIENAIRAKNPEANAQEVKAKAQEIAERMKNSAEPIEEKELEITRGEWRTTPQIELPQRSGSFNRGQTQVAVSGRDFSDVNAIKNYERNLQGVSSVSPNQKIQENRNVFQKAFDYMTKTAKQSAENPLLISGAYLGAAPALAALPLSGAASAAAPVASNILQFPTAAKVASGAAGAAGTVLNFASRAAAESPASSGYGRFAPTVWNAETRSVDAITSAAPKVTTPVSTPSLSSGLQTAAQNVVNKLNQIRTNTNKLTTKEKRLGGL